MHGHVPPGAAGCGKHHVTAPALEHLRVVMRGQVSVEAAATEVEFGLGKLIEWLKYLPNKAFTALEAYIRPLSCVGSCMCHQVGGFLDKTMARAIRLPNSVKP